MILISATGMEVLLDVRMAKCHAGIQQTQACGRYGLCGAVQLLDVDVFASVVYQHIVRTLWDVGISHALI